MDFANDWAGRYSIQKEEFTTVFANGSVGYRGNDWLSVGAGVSAVHGELEYKASLNNVFDGGADGLLEFDDTDVDIGVVYPAKLHFTGIFEKRSLTGEPMDAVI